MSEQYIEKYFKTLLEKRERLHTDEKLVRELLAEHILHIPKKLYKYRVCPNEQSPQNSPEERNLKLLANKEVFIPFANSFQDPFDYTLIFDIEKQKDRIIQFLSSKEVLTRLVFKGTKEALSKNKIYAHLSLTNVEYIFDKYFLEDGTCLEKEFEEEIVGPASKKEKLAYQIVKNNMKVILDRTTDQARRIASDIANEIYGICQRPRKENLVYCMTENKASGPMWEHYAGNYSGYCVEYDFSIWESLPFDEIKNLIYIFPVSYLEEKPQFDVEPYFQLAVKYFYGEEIPTELLLSIEIELNKQLLRKHIDYAYEKEWRFTIKHKCGQTLLFPFVSAIYLGKDITEPNQNRICDIAAKLNVKVYKQKLSFFGNELRFEEIKR